MVLFKIDFCVYFTVNNKNMLSKEDHLDILEQIKEERQNQNDEHIVHRTLMYMMDQKEFEPSSKILSEILKERPDLEDEIKIFKDIVKEIRNIFRQLENEMTP
jgi:hypothetical protein